MSSQHPAAQGSAATAPVSRKFSEMGFFEKIQFIGKAGIFFLSLGFAYPNIFLD